jgi:hypothetical protein
MKIRSKKLYAYLKETGALEKGPGAIREAKKEYRRIYKRDWKRSKRQVSRVIEIRVSLKEYKALQNRCIESNTKPFDFAKEVLCVALNNTDFIPNKTLLQKVLQQLSIVNIAMQKGRGNVEAIKNILNAAEQMLDKYLHRKN